MQLTTKPRPSNRPAHRGWLALIATLLIGAVAAFGSAPTQAATPNVTTCKVAISNAYGPQWQVTMTVRNSGDHYLYSGRMRVTRNWGQVIHDDSVTAYRGQTKRLTTYVSRALADSLYISSGFGEANGQGAGGGGVIDPASLSNC